MNLRTTVLGCGLAVLLAACSVPDALQRQQAPTLYVLDVPGPPAAAPSAERSDWTIAVAMPHAWPGFDTAEIAYTVEPNRIEYFARSEWADTPARMLGPLLVRALERSGHFRAVVTTGSGIRADARLDTEIVTLQQEFGSESSVSRTVLRAQLVDVANGRVLATRTFEASEPAGSDDAAGGVAAMNRAVQRLIDQIVDWCGEVAARRVSAEQ